ncbi:MAG TPA: PQQ-binding-like beta-propeller repeat protein, partial [Arachidicoccus sp.]|nr:PQQ-binding-like beta-propeller repeat protein [Arachidicoccus sp.]
TFPRNLTGSGPNMRMGPGQIPREGIVWLDSTLSHLNNKQIPIIFVNHYPLDSGLNNWYDAIDKLKKHNVQLLLNGHWHRNAQLNTEGIPAVVTRSTLRAKDTVGGYNIVHIHADTATFCVRRPGGSTEAPWANIPLVNHHFIADTTRYARPSYSVNKEYPVVTTKWQFTDSSDISSGVAEYRDVLITTNTGGWLMALNKKDGHLRWKFRTGGKIYSTPGVAGDLVVVASTDKNIYCVNAKTGKLVWKFATEKPNVACPLLADGKVYIGGSDGHFRALDLHSGQLIWDFAQVKGFMVDRPLLYGGKLYFGCWANDFYALDAATGKLCWKWNNGSGNRMYSPAACWPVATDGRVFIVAPDRKMTALDANTGKVIWRKGDPDRKVRESMGLSCDSQMVYTKTMQGALCAFSTTADSMRLVWQPDVALGYEICPTPIFEKDQVVYLPTGSGLVVAVSRKTSQVLWKYKVSNGLVNSILPLENHTVIVSTMDGKITCLKIGR